MFVGCDYRELEEVHIIDMYSGSKVKWIRVIGNLRKHMSTQADLIHLVDLHSGSVVKRIRGPKGLCSHLSTQAGLVCVSAEPIDRAAQDLVLNPATGAVSALPVGDRPSMVLACVLGHVPSTGEYKVVRVGNQVEERMKTVFQVVALGGGEQRWRTKPSPVDIITDSRFIAVVSGVAYFMATYDDDEHDDDSGSDMGPELVLFDLATEEWRPTIIYGPLHEADRIQIVSLDECLVIADHKDQDCSMDLWFLMDADNASYWTKRYSMRCAPHFDHAPMYPPRLLVILEDGRIVALLKWKDLLIVYDPKTQTWDDFTTVTYYSAIGMHQGSLLDSDLLAWNLELPSD
nr:unnamed protein product [Digitaria exilis]